MLTVRASRRGLTTPTERLEDILESVRGGHPVHRAATRSRADLLADLTLEAFLQEWLGQIVSQRVRANTLSAYRFQAERYLIPDLGRKKLVSLSARDLRCTSNRCAVARWA